MSGSKGALKAINAAIKAQKYDDVVRDAHKLLASDPKSYQAYVLSTLPGCRTTNIFVRAAWCVYELML
jgi:hypothetical protein